MSDGRDRQVRILPGMFAVAQYWIEIVKKDGDKISIPKFSRNFDPITATFDSTKPCPYQENQEHFTHKGKPGAQCQIHYYVNVLSRDMQDDEPKSVRRTSREEETGFKDKDSKSWTPVRVLRLPPTVIKRLQKLQLMNRSRRARDGAPLSDPKLGRDVMISFDSKAASPGEMWFVQLYEKQTALHEEEQEYLMYNIEAAIEKLRDQETDEEAEAWVQKLLGSSGGGRSRSDDDERPASRRRRSRREEPEDDEPEDDEDIDGEDEDEELEDEEDLDFGDEDAPEDEDEVDGGEDDYGSDELDDEEEEPEDEEPPRRRRRASRQASGRTHRRQAEPEDEEEEPDEEPPRRRRTRHPSRQRSGSTGKRGSRSSDFKFNRRRRDEDVDLDDDEIPF